MSRVKESLRRLARQSGWDVVRFRGDFARHQLHLLETRQIGVVADVGANEGQYASRLRLLGYGGPIVSFEPYPTAARRLRQQAKKDGRWTVHEVAVDRAPGQKTLNISANSVSSSLLQMTGRHIAADPHSDYVDRVDVQAEPLDAFIDDLEGCIWLKIDVQGGERGVLEGATKVLERTEVIQAELSLVELYRHAPTALELITELAAMGFDMVNVEPGFTDRESGALLQADGLFLCR